MSPLTDRPTRQLLTGDAGNPARPMIRVTDLGGGRESGLDVYLDTVLAIQDLKGPDGRYIGAKTAIHLAGRTEPFRVQETRAEIYALAATAGVNHSIGTFLA